MTDWKKLLNLQETEDEQIDYLSPSIEEPAEGWPAPETPMIDRAENIPAAQFLKGLQDGSITPQTKNQYQAPLVPTPLDLPSIIDMNRPADQVVDMTSYLDALVDADPNAQMEEAPEQENATQVSTPKADMPQAEQQPAEESLENQEPEGREPNPIEKLIGSYREALERAQGSRKDAELMNLFTRATKGMIEADATKRGADFKADYEPEKQRLISAAQDVKDVGALFEADQADIKLEQQARMQDPESGESKTYQEIALQLAPGLKDKIGSMSAAQLSKLIPGLQTIANARIRQEEGERRLQELQHRMAKDERFMAQRDEGEARRQNQAEINTARNFLKDDPRFKKAVEQGSIYKEIDTLVDQVDKENNQAALAALGTKLARAMGEVGVLTDADVVRYLGSRSWGRKINEWVAGGMKGTLPQDSIRELRKNIAFFKKKVYGEVDEIYNNAEERLVTAMKVTPERARELVGPRPFMSDREPASTTAPELKKAPGDEIVERNGKRYKWNPARGKYQIYSGE